ncbi:DUF6653 family protein [Roseibium sp.]|uniref:DUF6653 family protein n=1 Tax=Roseibium sp. TaxID=1936156 RepID=UPI003A986A2C
MDASTWQRHASPWSVYTRMATLPLLALAIWSHAWYGAWLAIGATFAVCAWLWVNPRLFPPPKTMESWASKATLGERIWLNRSAVPIPGEDSRTAMTLSLVTGVGFIATVYGSISNELLIAVPGLIVTYAGKLVFLDRMVRLYEQMRNAHPLYRFWSVAPDNDNTRKAQSA